MKISHYKYIVDKYQLSDKSDSYVFGGSYKDIIINPLNIHHLKIDVYTHPQRYHIVDPGYRGPIFGPFNKLHQARWVLNDIKQTEILFV